MTGKSVTAEVEISASPGQGWNALTDPDLIRKYFFGTEVETSWEPGSPITWSGEYDGREYQDKGEVLEVVPEERLVVTHFSPMSGQEDTPENYHRITYQLDDEGDSTHVILEPLDCLARLAPIPGSPGKQCRPATPRHSGVRLAGLEERARPDPPR